ncbi:ribonuclease P protein component, partial [Gammaproteobacteria bacterium]|nr:ribonuclease P protein component [Gammaproteobacteria bacterium]
RKVEKEEVPIRLLVHAPKKRFKRAVHRNRYKRLLRECYRLNNEAFKTTMQDKDYTLHLSITAVSNHIPTYAELEPKVIAALNELIQRLNS